jgi:hypothetical protein
LWSCTSAREQYQMASRRRPRQSVLSVVSLPAREPARAAGRQPLQLLRARVPSRSLRMRKKLVRRAHRPPPPQCWLSARKRSR